MKSRKYANKYREPVYKHILKNVNLISEKSLTSNIITVIPAK